MAVLLQYNMTAGLAPSTQDADVTGGTITNELLNSLTTGNNTYASDPVGDAAPASGATSAANAITTDSFFYFSITPISGKQITLTSLDFNMARGGGATPRGYDVRSSVDNFATTLETADLATARNTWTAVSVDLTGGSFNNLSSTVTFKVYLYSPDPANVIDFDDVVVNGSTSSGGTVEQEGFLWREDDGTETTATSVAAQDTNIIREKTDPVRLRVLLDSTLDRGTESYKLEYRKVGDSTWLDVA